MGPFPSEQQPLLQQSDRSHAEDDWEEDRQQKVTFTDYDPENPQYWRPIRKYAVVLQVAMIAFFLPMASSIYTPASDLIKEDFGASGTVVLLNQTAFVCMMGIGPLFLAPMSETFGRRTIYLICLVGFVIVQLPTALAPNIETFIVFRTLSGFFGSVGVGNGGGSISDMFGVRDRAVALGFYLIFPLLAPTIGPLVGSILADHFNWRWISGVNMILAGTMTVISYFFLYETRAVSILQERRRELEKDNPDVDFYVEGASKESTVRKVLNNSTRAVKILTTQPMVLILSIYQALIFITMYSLYATYADIWSNPPYSFNKTQVGLAYVPLALGFIVTGAFLVMFMDRVYDAAASWNDDDDGQPEYRLPMSAGGAILLPIALFWFGWTVEKQLHWPVPLVAMLLFGAAQVSLFNPIQTYMIDAYGQNAASALAAGAFLRSTFGGIIPLFVSSLFEKLGYGLGFSVFGALAVILMPAPAVFYWYGRRLRERFPFKG